MGKNLAARIELEGQIKMEEMCFSRFLKMVRIQLLGLSSRSFHQMGTVNEKVCESDFVPLWDGTVMRRSLAERKLLDSRGHIRLK